MLVVAHPEPRRWVYGPALVVAPQGQSIRVWHAAPEGTAVRYEVTEGSETTTGDPVSGVLPGMPLEVRGILLIYVPSGATWSYDLEEVF